MLILGIILVVVGLFVCYLADKIDSLSLIFLGCAVLISGIYILCVGPKPHFDMQGCIQNCEAADQTDCLCYQCCGHRYIRLNYNLVCKEYIWPYLNDAAKECNCDKENQ